MDEYEAKTIDFAQNIARLSGIGIIIIAILNMYFWLATKEVFFIALFIFGTAFSLFFMYYTIHKITLDQNITVKRTFDIFVVPRDADIKFIVWGSTVIIRFLYLNGRKSAMFLDIYEQLERIKQKMKQNGIIVKSERFSILKWCFSKITNRP